MNAELIDGLRWCADESICCDDFSGEKCPYYDEKKDSCSTDEILHAAADALEAADKRIAELMPKEGEWQGIIIDGQYWAITCSNCHQVGFNAKTPYCPNCGAKMDGERKDKDDE